jgi:hypothetical protein
MRTISCFVSRKLVMLQALYLQTASWDLDVIPSLDLYNPP